VLSTVRGGLRRGRGRDLPEPNRQNKTYAHMLGQIFIDPLVPGGHRRPYTWDRETAVEISQVTGRPAGEFTQVPPRRPFLIVGGTLVWQHPALVYPRLIPVEYTPLYTGVRQQYGPIGGTYVWPWAYDRLEVAEDSESFVRVGPGPGERMFTLADVIASSGAAPQLELLLGGRVPARLRGPLRRAADVFPAFTNLAVRTGGAVPIAGELAHGDGGFTDNLGLMPLLARQVRNVIVFVNSNREYPENDQLESYFVPLSVRNGSGDKSFTTRGSESKALRHFPYYATFEENKPYVIKLNALQVNLLADLSCWTITNDESVRIVTKVFGNLLPVPSAGRKALP